MGRRRGTGRGMLLALGLVTSLGGVAMAAPPAQADVIVVLHEGVDARATAQDMARSHGARIGHVYEHALTGFHALVPEGRLGVLERDPRVAYVDENQIVHAVEYPNGVKRIDGDDAHAAASTLTGEGVRVAIVDTGIDLDHPDLDANVDTTTDYDCVNNDAVADDDQGHGTHVAGTVAAEKNGSQVVGVAPKATLVGFKVLGSNGSGTWDQVICGVDRITMLNTDTVSGNEIHVANMSLGGSGSHDGTTCAQHTESTTMPSSSLFDAICKAIASGTTFTVAAGNDSKDASGFVPAAYPDVITVSAFSDTDGTWNSSTTCSGMGIFKTCDEAFASFSNYGTIVDVIAPGVSIVSTTYDGKTGSKSGTSMAAPHAAGVAALVIDANPGLTPAQVADHLQYTGQCPAGTMNGASGYCASGSWNSDPDAPLTEPMANAYWAVTTAPVSSSNNPPAASDDSGTTKEDTATTVSVLANDTDKDGDTLTVTAVTSPANGTATISTDGTKVTYTPSANFHGSDQFSYTVSDGKGGSASAKVTVTVESVNDAPVAGDDTASTTPGNPVIITVLANDADVEDGRNLTVTAPATSTNGGTVAVNADGTITYTPKSGFTGTDTFDYTVTDSGTLTDTATVTVTVSDAATTMSIGDLDSTSISHGSRWTPQVTVLVVDTNGKAVAGVTVAGDWGGGASGPGSCTTDSSGRCSIKYGTTFHKSVSSVTFTVTGISGSSTLTYDATKNNDPDGDSNGTTITVTKP